MAEAASRYGALTRDYELLEKSLRKQSDSSDQKAGDWLAERRQLQVCKGLHGDGHVYGAAGAAVVMP